MTRTDKPSVAVIIVTWNSANDIEICLNSLSRQSYPITKIVVVDNASNDDTTDIISKNYSFVNLIRNRVNEGFAKGNNIGISSIDTDLVLTLNPDAKLEQDYIEKLIDFAVTHPNVGLITGKLFRDGQFINNKQVIDSAGIEIYDSRRVKDRGSGQLDEGAFETPERVFGGCAAATLYRKEMLDDISPDNQYFAESFFAYYEDADLAWRAFRRGWEVWYVPTAICWHRRGGSPVGSRFSRSLTHRNRLWMIARNEPLTRTVKSLPSLLIHEFLMTFRMIRYPYLFKSTIEALIGLPEAIRYRKSLPDKINKKPPFTKGTGFSWEDVGIAVKRRNK
ncbi:MAG: glycosyltransferase family 2 protein [Candidatus Hatepunaea meridiana]|nr:glycosyltransferase family 2 protein [Candidatus Hatepunaea meridiana]